MSNQGATFRRTRLTAMILSGMLFFSPSLGFGQEAAAPAQEQAAAATPVETQAAPTAIPAEAPPTQAAGDTPVETQEDAQGDAKTTDAAAADADTADEAAADAKGADDTSTIPAVGDDAKSDDPADAPAGGATNDTTAPGTNGTTPPAGGAPYADSGGTSTMKTILIAIVVIALFVLPVMAGGYLARAWKMPDHGWKLSLTIGVLAASLVIVTFGEFKFGTDLAGGLTLIYEVADSGGRDVPMDALIAALKNRVDPTSTREVSIRAYGSAVEIIIPETGGDAVQYIKRRITDLGQLEFRITAEPTRTDGIVPQIIAQAMQLPPGQKDVVIAGRKVAEWVAYAEAEFRGPSVTDERIVKRVAAGTPEALVLIDPWNVTGEYLTSATKGADERGGPAVNFAFNAAGAGRFRQLTGDNLPNNATGAMRYLGIILDKRLISAPSIRATISDRGEISGSAMDGDEVDYIISILNAGSLPAALNKTPISEQVISPTLGAETVAQGEFAVVASLVAVVVFMIIYYRFSGTIACIALALNLLLVVSLMVMISAAFTLPGLAGLVLTIGMSVDANVLIYERIREELRAGAALRMAIRNGFGRAMSAIIDANVTTIIAGLSLYLFATDQVKGFAVTLILGILTSMFTAIFVSRVMFDVAERRGWLKNIRMLNVFPDSNFDFLKYRYAAIAFSVVMIAIGMIALFFRGGQLLDIDFTGGTSVTFSIHQSDKMPLPEVRAALTETELGDRNLVVVERGTTNTVYTVATSEQSVDTVKRVIGEKFGDKLMKSDVQVGPIQPFAEGELKGVESVITINTGPEYGENDGVSHAALLDQITALLVEEHAGIQPTLSNDLYRPGSVARYKEWGVRLPELDEQAAQTVLQNLERQMEAEPLFPLANTIGGRVSGDMKNAAALAIFVSLVGVVIYLWLRFQKVSYGLAAAAAVVHDVLVTVGFLALSAYVVQAVPRLAAILQIDAFQINLTIVAALLTIMGYSLNDTIVTFDRVREVKGKSPKLTAEMVNKSVNQTLARTILTTVTVFIVVIILYFMGGAGIHGFAFSFLVGVIFGCYSSVYIAAPVLLWLSGSSSSMSKEIASPNMGSATPAMSR